MTTSRFDADLALALALADAADAISLRRFGAADLAVEAKPDFTPVTDADRDVEQAIRAIVTAERPGDAIVGEEFGGSAADQLATGRCWVVDPIDGTKNFVRGVPIWATLIALLEDGVPVVGAVTAPSLARRWWGLASGGAWTSFAGEPARPCRVSQVGDIADASLSIALPAAWEGAGRGEQAREFSRRAWRTRGYGDFYPYMLVAEGAVDVAGEPELSLWDLAALGPIVTGAGGRFTDVDGREIGPRSASALATNGLLHPAAISGLAAQ